MSKRSLLGNPRSCRWCVLLGCLGAPRVALGQPLAQIAAIPTRLELNVGADEVEAGAVAPVVIHLRNVRNEDIEAPEALVLTLASNLADRVQVTLPKGASSIRSEVRFSRPGIARLRVSAPRIASGYAAVVVKAVSRSVSLDMAPRAAAGEVEVHPAAPRPREPAAVMGPALDLGPRAAPREAEVQPRRPRPPERAPSPAGGTAVTVMPPQLGIEVIPTDVHPRAGRWVADVWLVTLNPRGEPAPSPMDLPVNLVATVGTVNPVRSLIAAGSVRPASPIQLVADRSGAEKVWAWLDTSARTVSAEAVYKEALPSKLRVVAYPVKAVNSGKNPVRITVMLLDDTNLPASFPDRELEVTVTSSLGTIEPKAPVHIARGAISGEAVLTSTTAGRAEVRALALHMPDAETGVEFVFPWLMVVLAMAGGTLGATYRGGWHGFSRGWQRHAAVNGLAGLLLGTIFYALSLLGAPAAIPQVALPIAAIPTVNELGALALGFLGGYYARAWLPLVKTGR